MRTRLTFAVIAALLLCGSPAFAVELLYTWNQGDVHRFQYEDQTRMEVAMPGMGGMGIQMPGMSAGGGGVSVDMAVRTTFAMKIRSVDAAGNADAELLVEKLTVLAGGQVLGTLDQLPEEARRARATIDRKGRVVFKRLLTVYFADDQVYVAVRADEKGLSATGGVRTEEGEITLDAVAGIDRKTGKVTASASIKDKPTALTRTRVKEDTPKVDTLPAALFDLLVLPDGDLLPGSTVTMKTPMTSMAVAMGKLDAGIADLTFKSRTDTAEVPGKAAPAPAATEEEDEEDGFGDADDGDDMGDDMGGMGMGGMGMGGMGMGMGMGGMATGGTRAQAPAAGTDAPPTATFDVDVASRFDTGAGKLLDVEGSVDTSMDMAGMGKTRITSRFKLQRLEK